MKKILLHAREVALAGAMALMAYVMIGWVINPVYHTIPDYPSSQKLEMQGFKRLPGETPEEHEKRGRSVIDYARSFPG